MIITIDIFNTATLKKDRISISTDIETAEHIKSAIRDVLDDVKTAYACSVSVPSSVEVVSATDFCDKGGK